eukprot:TRINITY_DN39418_c0_g1_i1.p1 TRINITY_DN39418_c0_g1~~TRINITY_DN39418_c0_g1_i1.p1  ORF type:complete len:606 (+),score=169.78 TRINITY_DN39418_c0_g1_i1:95-1819(+)
MDFGAGAAPYCDGENASDIEEFEQEEEEEETWDEDGRLEELELDSRYRSRQDSGLDDDWQRRYEEDTFVRACTGTRLANCHQHMQWERDPSQGAAARKTLTAELPERVVARVVATHSECALLKMYLARDSQLSEGVIIGDGAGDARGEPTRDVYFAPSPSSVHDDSRLKEGDIVKLFKITYKPIEHKPAVRVLSMVFGKLDSTGTFPEASRCSYDDTRSAAEAVRRFRASVQSRLLRCREELRQHPGVAGRSAVRTLLQFIVRGLSDLQVPKDLLNVSNADFSLVVHDTLTFMLEYRDVETDEFGAEDKLSIAQVDKDVALEAEKLYRMAIDSIRHKSLRNLRAKGFDVFLNRELPRPAFWEDQSARFAERRKKLPPRFTDPAATEHVRAAAAAEEDHEATVCSPERRCEKGCKSWYTNEEFDEWYGANSTEHWFEAEQRRLPDGQAAYESDVRWPPGGWAHANRVSGPLASLTQLVEFDKCTSRGVPVADLLEAENALEQIGVHRLNCQDAQPASVLDKHLAKMRRLGLRDEVEKLSRAIQVLRTWFVRPNDGSKPPFWDTERPHGGRAWGPS